MRKKKGKVGGRGKRGGRAHSMTVEVYCVKCLMPMCGLGAGAMNKWI